MDWEKTLFALKGLAAHLPALYAVGGAVRDSLLGTAIGDVDIAAPMLPAELEKLLVGTEYRVVPVSPRLGTVLVVGGGVKAEYTTFRSDSYPVGSGCHVPQSVSFSDNLQSDAVRRDFSVNALYLDLKTGDLVDVVGGLADLKSKTLRAVTTPDKVFAEDGLRVMRLARFAAELGFSVEERTLAAAKAHADGLADISVERIAEELKKILVADTRHRELGLSNAPSLGLRVLLETGAMKYVVPELEACKGVNQNPLYHRYDVLEHTLATVDASVPEVRLAALFHDLGKPPAVAQDGNMYRHPELGAELAKKRLEALKFPKKVVRDTERLVLFHMKDMREDMHEGKLRLFLVENADIATRLFALKKADMEGTGTAKPPYTVRMESVFSEMKEDGTPFSVADLAVGGDALVKLGVAPERRAAILNDLLREVILNPALRSEEKQRKYLERRAITE